MIQMPDPKMPAPIMMVLVAAICWCATLAAAFAQEAVPVEILNRTIFIKVGNEAGSAFTIDYLGKLYLITARHVVSGVPESNAIIQVRRADKWEDYHTLRTLYPASNDAAKSLSSEMANAAAEANAKAGGATTKEITTPAAIAARLTAGP